MLLRTVLVAFALIGCASGQAEPASSPESVESEMEPAAAASEGQPEDAVSPDEKSADDAGQAASGGAASPEEIRQILQAVLDDEALQTHLKLEEPGRFPLQVAKRNVPAGIELIKSTEPAKIVDAPKDKKDPVLVFTEVSVGPNTASVRYRYDVEGVRGSCTLKRANGRWELTRSRITQY